METVLIILAVLVVVGGAGAFFVARSRSGRAETLEPPRPPAGTITKERPGGTTVLEPPPEVLAPEDAAPTLEAPPVAPPEVEAPPEAPPDEPVEELVKPTFRDRLAKARGAFAGALGSIRGRDKIDAAAWEELEDALLVADVGIGPAEALLDAVRARVKEEGIEDADGLIAAVKAEMKARLAGPVELRTADEPPSVWLFVGVNGVGKTTTIGKVGRRLADEGKSIVMAAGDTFRAAAAEQLGTWADRSGADLVRGAEGGDPSSVIFDAIARGAANGADVVLCDTAGRLHTKANLMEELSKVRRVADKGAGTVTEVLLVIDATTGQNGLVQARQFTEATDVTGVVLTKLDGSAKGGIVFAIASELGIPVKLVGLGETAADLVDFDADEFVEALFAE